jgi:hypothetical protein
MQYSYTVTRVDQDAKCMEVEFTADTFDKVVVGVRLPILNEDVDSVIQSFAPLAIWQPQVIEYAEITVGKSGTYVPPTPEQLQQNLQNAQMWEQVAFDKRIAETLVRLGVLQSDPTTINVSQL